MKLRLRHLPILIFVPLLSMASAHAQDNIAAFYKGKQLRLIVGSAVGGGYDLYSRALARHIVNHIPGNPTIIVQNQPAAGGVVMTNQLTKQGPHDGTVFAAPLNGIATAPMLVPGTQFDASQLNWIGSLVREPYVAFLWHTAPISHISELATKEVLVGSTTVGTTMNDFPLLLNDLLGYKFKIVRGYQGHAGDQHRNRARRDPGQCRRRACFGQDADAEVDRREEDKVHRAVQPAALPGTPRRADGDGPRQD